MARKLRIEWLVLLVLGGVQTSAQKSDVGEGGGYGGSSSAASRATATGYASVTLLSPIEVKNGQSDTRHSESVAMVQDGAGNWRKVQVLDFE